MSSNNSTINQLNKTSIIHFILGTVGLIAGLRMG